MNLYRRALEVFRKNIVFYIILGILYQLCLTIDLNWLSQLTHLNSNVCKFLFITVVSPLPDFILLIITCRAWNGEKAHISDLKTLWVSFPSIILFTAFLNSLYFLDPMINQSVVTNGTVIKIIKSILSIFRVFITLAYALYFAKKANNEKSAFHHTLKLVFHHPLVTIGIFIIIFWSFILIVAIFFLIISLMSRNVAIILKWIISPVFITIASCFLIEWSMRLNNRFETN